jgi:hypothetical protein
VNQGPAVTRYELQPEPGVKVAKIANLADDIALNLAAQGVRIDQAGYGVGVPLPNPGLRTAVRNLGLPAGSPPRGSSSTVSRKYSTLLSPRWSSRQRGTTSKHSLAWSPHRRS